MHNGRIAAAGYRMGVPITSHVSVGGDIIHAMLNCDGAALGRASYTDFLIFARAIQDLEGGVFLNVGSAVTGPEVYLKALSMARNVARYASESGTGIDRPDPSQSQFPSPRHFTTAVFDLVGLPNNFRGGPPGKDHPLYYYRPWKTILCRTIADGGTSFYFQGCVKTSFGQLGGFACLIYSALRLGYKLSASHFSGGRWDRICPCDRIRSWASDWQVTTCTCSFGAHGYWFSTTCSTMFTR